jgi:enoyl-[acyl-carrier protein] reductase I
MNNKLMSGRRGLVMGVANDHSIAWGIASQLHKHGAELAFTYQGEAFGKRVKPLADEVGSKLLLPCDVEDVATVDAVFDELKKAWGKIDFLVHAIAFSDKNELKGKYADTTRENFIRTMVISCFSFTEIARRAAAMMPDGGSLLTLTYGGSVRVMPLCVGVAKGRLASGALSPPITDRGHGVPARRIDADPGEAVIGDARHVQYQQNHAPLRRAITLEEVGVPGSISCRALERRHRESLTVRLQHHFHAAPEDLKKSAHFCRLLASRRSGCGEAGFQASAVS